jgi:osmoprotectant transport system substrate-binding protein
LPVDVGFRRISMRSWGFRALVSLALGLSLMASACGSSGGTKGTITIGTFSFSESSILAHIYGGALENAGYMVKYKPPLGARPVVAPALERGDIDLYPGYTASDLDYYDNKQNLGTNNPKVNRDKLNGFISKKGLEALDPAPARNQNAFAVTKATADEYGLHKLSDLGRVATPLMLGGPPDCPGRNDCEAGLKKVYGAKISDFKPLDFGGPITLDALQHGNIQLGLVFSSDGSVAARNFVILNDDKHMVSADAIVPIGRTQVLTGDVAKVLNDVSSRLTTPDLVQMNKNHVVQHTDPEQLASDWLKMHSYK